MLCLLGLFVFVLCGDLIDLVYFYYGSCLFILGCGGLLLITYGWFYRFVYLAVCSFV